MPEVLELEIVGEGIRLQLLPTNTVFQLVQLCCDEYLDRARGGDGDVFGHCWKLHKCANGVESWHCDGPYGNDFNMDGSIGQSSDNSTALAEFDLAVGDTLKLEYDFGDTSRVVLKVVALEGMSAAEASGAPCRMTAAVDTSFAPHSPPPGMPTLDEMFPNLAKLVFDPRVCSVGFFPANAEVTAFIEAGPNAMGDLLFAPVGFGGGVDSAEELLAACDRACDARATAKLVSTVRWDAISRWVFPASIADPKAEQKCARFLRELRAFDAAMAACPSDCNPLDAEESGLSEAHMYRACGPKETATRPSAEERTAAAAGRAARGFDFAAAFPKCAAACARPLKGKGSRAPYRWLALRHGALVLCEGAATRERELPPGGELARLESGAHPIDSLQALFCAAEALWPDEGGRSNKKQRSC